jgi:pyrroline-5-carboxylate reductase
MFEKKVAFLGAGNMGGALIKGLIKKGLDKKYLFISDKFQKEKVEKRFKIKILDNTSCVKKADVILICVKPQDIFSLLKEIEPAIDDEKLIISIVAGVGISSIEKNLQKKGRIVRVMPNIAALVGEAISCFCKDEKVKEKDEKIVYEILSSIGKVEKIEEGLLDAVTGLSGSGPAYVFEMIEAMADGGVKMGLKRDTAMLLSAQTVKGAAEMVLKLKKHPAQLKDMVTSPAGTTIYGLSILEEKGMRDAFIKAIEQATKRSKELKMK